MNKYEIRDEIRYSEAIIDSYSEQIRVLKEDIDRLACLRERLGELQTELEERQSVRKRRLSEFLYAGFRLKIVSKYYSGMEALLSGTEFRRAYDGLAEAKAIVLREENKLREQLEVKKVRKGDVICLGKHS